MALVRNHDGELPFERLHNQKVMDSDQTDTDNDKEESADFYDSDLDENQSKFGNVPKDKRDLLYKRPDLVAVFIKDQIDVIKLELESLVKGECAYYEIFEREDQDTNLLVIFFEDARLDAKAEQMKIPVKLMEFRCKLPFKCYAANSFHRFNARQSQNIINQIISEELEVDTLV